MREVLATGLLLVSLAVAGVRAAEPVSFTVDAASSGKTIGNKLSDINVWQIGRTWLQTAKNYPNDYFQKAFPFVERVQLICATGGSEYRDLFKNPNDRATLTDYDFGKLLRACENIVAKGLKPMIKTGWGPLKLSDHPKLSHTYKTNLRPPENYDVYYTYIRAIAEALRERFGLEEVKTWTWGVGIEYESRDWFLASDENPDSTAAAYCKLYDYTVAALEDALGPENVTVGGHSCAHSDGFWDELKLIDHCGGPSRRDTNACRR